MFLLEVVLLLLNAPTCQLLLLKLASAQQANFPLSPNFPPD